MSASYLFRQSDQIIDSKFLPPFAPVLYGSFSSSQTQFQTGGVANTPTVITYNTTEIASGISYDPANPSRIRVGKTGIYKLFYSIQADKVSGSSASTLIMWIRKNGNNLPNTAGQIVVNSSKDESLPCVEHILSLNANDFIEVVFSCDNATLGITAYPENTIIGIPATPSIITNIIQIA